jgi:S1-C subfamily serine protease
MWDQGEFLDKLKTTVENLDRDGSALLCDELISHLHGGTVLGDGMGRRILTLLRRKTYFEQMERVAEALLFTSQDDAQIRRQYAQALIDQKRLTAAVYVLETLVERTEGIDPRENAEARGLLGRVYKQLYINAVLADPKAAAVPLHRLNLQRAVDAYLSVYRAAPARHLWHGINAAALALRAVRDQVPLRDTLDGAALARDVLATIEAREDQDAWDLATGAEAWLALEKPDKALQWVARYVVRPEADAFELASTLRQLKEVWGLTIDTMPGSLLLPLLQSQLLQRSGGRVDLAAGEARPTIKKTEEHTADAKQLQKILGKEGVVSLGWYKLGLDRTQAVAKILNKTGDGFGTGFLVRGSDLVPSLGDALLILTNAHVVSDDPAVQTKYGSLEPDEATIIFEACEAAGQQKFKAAKLLWTSPPDQLDATLLQVDPPLPGIEPYPVAKRLPLVDGVQKVYVIGHPLGGGLSISLNDNLLLDYDDRLLHYRAPTEGGSSGSPVFNQKWDLIGLHHAGGMAMKKLKGQEGTYAANAGIWIQRIIKALAEAGITGAPA